MRPDPGSRRRRARKKRSGLGRHLWLFIALPGVAAIVLLAIPRHLRETGNPAPRVPALDGYQRDVAVLTQEYRKFHGRPLRNAELEEQFQLATRAAARKDYPAAIELLEAASKQAAVPVIFGNLGALYAATGERSRAIAAFREALARDGEYRPARDSIKGLEGFTADLAEPLRQEAEPNDSNTLANLIALNTPVEGEIGMADVDSFRFVTPPAPRDILQLEVSNLSPTLQLAIRLYAGDVRNDSGSVNARPGESLTRYLSQAPDTQLFLQVMGWRDTIGHYRITIRALRAFDAYEANDDVFSARRIELGQTVDANIMDSEDTDFYSFASPRTGTVSIDIRNLSKELIPALTTFNSDKRNTGFGPDVRTPGASFHHSLEVVQNQVYFVQVWSQSHTAGKYQLTLQ